MANKAQMLRLLKDFGFAEARADWERYGEMALAYWWELDPAQREALARDHRLVAVWRAGVELGSAAEAAQVLVLEAALERAAQFMGDALDKKLRTFGVSAVFPESEGSKGG